MFKLSRYRQTCGSKEEMKNGKHKALINDEKKRHKHKRPALSARETTRLRQGTDWWQEWLGDKAIKNHHTSHSYFWRQRHQASHQDLLGEHRVVPPSFSPDNSNKPLETAGQCKQMAENAGTSAKWWQALDLEENKQLPGNGFHQLLQTTSIP